MSLQYVKRDKTTVEIIPTGIRCNACGRSRTVAEHGEHSYHHDMCVITMDGGYGDDYPADLQTLTFVACGDCLKKWTNTFVEPPDSTWAYGEPDSTFPATHSETGEAWVVAGLWTYPASMDFKAPEGPLSHGDAWYPTGGVWQHYKGNRYEVLKSIFSGTPDREVMVVYQALYGDSTTYVRPARMWKEHVEWEGYAGPRFTKVE